MEVVEFTVDGSDIVPKVPLSSHLCDMIVIPCLNLQYLTPSRQSQTCLRCFGYLTYSTSSSTSYASVHSLWITMCSSLLVS